LKMELSEKAEDWLCDMGYDPQFGARPMKRVIQREIVDQLAIHLIGGDFAEGDTVHVELGKDNKLRFSKVANAKEEKKIDQTKKKEEEAAAKAKKAKMKQLKELEKATKDVENTIREVRNE